MFRPEARVGTVVKRYRLAQVLSSGGMGSLYRATHLRTGREVAIKFLLDLDDTARFMIEARATVELEHPNVVDVLDMDETEDGVPFLVMELLLGKTLSAQLSELGRFDPPAVHTWLLPVLGAVAHAHGRGILHRDLKPDNIFLARGSDGRITPKLLDFGVAKTRSQPTITRSGSIVGTPAYMSPEQALAEHDLTAATDVWSMGVVLYECLTGLRPFEGDSATSVLLKVVRDAPPRLEQARPDLPLPWLRAVDRALQRNAAIRPQNMAEYARRILHGALEAGMSVPEDPDPLGLPEWRSWRSQASAGTVSVDARPQELAVASQPPRSAPPHVEPGAPTLAAGAVDLRAAQRAADADALPEAPAALVAPTRGSRARWLLWLGLLVVALGLLTYVLSGSSAPEAPAAPLVRESPVRAPEPAPRVQPKPEPPAPALVEPSAPAAAQPAPAVLPEQPPAQASKAARGKRRTPAAPSEAPPAEKPSAPASKPGDPSEAPGLPTIESDWR